ncbi:hypothetical protein WA538_002057 [Blastocystis sp. DL]
MNAFASTLPDTPITRINASLLTRSIGSMVSIVGTVETASGNTATLHSSDDQSVRIQCSNGFTYPIGRVVEVIGTVNNDGSITMQYATGFDGTYNAHAYNKLVEYMNGKFHGDLF